MPTKKKTYTTRLIAPMQSTGRCGKSTFVQALIAYFQFSGIQGSATDADAAHKTLFQWLPNGATHIPFTVAKDLQPILNECGSNPVEIIDFPAQATDQILEGLKTFRAKELFEEKGVRLTIPLFASDERVAMQSAAKIVQATKEYADYLLVTNSARYSSDYFLSSEALMSMIGECPRIKMLPITEITISEIDKASKEARKALTFVESLDYLPIASRMEIQTFLNALYCAFEDAAETILPDVGLIKNKVSRDDVADELEEINMFDL